MATSTGQRVGIWVLAVALIFGTLAGFVVMIIAPQNEAADAQRVQQAYEQYQEEVTAYQEKAEAQQKALEADEVKLSKQYYETLNSYKAKHVKSYDKAAAEKQLGTTMLREGSGETIKADSTYAAYYVGWLPDGKVFDGSIDGKKLSTPLIVRPDGVIEGWTEGVKGMKIGGARVLTIPSEKGYGENAQGDIPPNSPLKFIVLPVRMLETIEQPEIPSELDELYG